MNGTMAFMTRKLKVGGSVPMAQRMNKFLPPLGR
jgi:putative sterol carrier protein